MGVIAQKAAVRAAIVATCVSMILTFVLSNTALALTDRNFCIVLFVLPFTAKAYRLPDWMWGPGPLLAWIISSGGAVALWVALGVKRLRSKRLRGLFTAPPDSC